MKRASTAHNPITKVTQVFQRADGSEARITATLVGGPVYGDEQHVTVDRRDGPDKPWRECSTQPHEDWRSMSIDEYTQHGRPEHLRTVTFAELVKTSSLLGRDLDRSVDEGIVAYAPGQAPTIRRDAPLADHIEHFLSVVRQELGSDPFENGQGHSLAYHLQELFGGRLHAIHQHKMSEMGAHVSTNYSHMTCEIEGKCYDIGGANADKRWAACRVNEPDAEGLISEFGYVVLDREGFGEFLMTRGAEPTDQELAARLRALGRREIQAPIALLDKELDASGCGQLLGSC